jgi:hypothetical protein
MHILNGSLTHSPENMFQPGRPFLHSPDSDPSSDDSDSDSDEISFGDPLRRMVQPRSRSALLVENVRSLDLMGSVCSDDSDSEASVTSSVAFDVCVLLELLSPSFRNADPCVGIEILRHS